MNSSSGGSRLRAPTSATFPAATAPESISIRSGIPHVLPDGDVSGVFRSPCASSQTTPIRSWPALRPSTAPTCEQQSPPRTSGRAGRSCASDSDCSAEGLLLDDRRLRVWEREPRGLRHRLAAVSPGARHAHHARAERAPARVALVLRPERDRGLRLAIGALGAEAGHQTSFWYHTSVPCGLIPARSYRRIAVGLRPSTPRPHGVSRVPRTPGTRAAAARARARGRATACARRGC